MFKNIKNLFSLLKTSPLIAGNSRAVNLFLFLFAISYFVVGADLCKEIAKERNEIEFINGLTEESIHTDNSVLNKLINNLPKEPESLPSVIFSIFSTGFYLYPPGRSPPEA